MLIDLYLHECLHLSCSLMNLKTAVVAAREQGLAAMGVTDHDSMGIRDSPVMKTLGFPVFVGVEFAAAEGGDHCLWPRNVTQKANSRTGIH